MHVDRFRCNYHDKTLEGIALLQENVASLTGMSHILCSSESINTQGNFQCFARSFHILLCYVELKIMAFGCFQENIPPTSWPHPYAYKYLWLFSELVITGFSSQQEVSSLGPKPRASRLLITNILRLRLRQHF